MENFIETDGFWLSEDDFRPLPGPAIGFQLTPVDERESEEEIMQPQS